MDSQQVVWSARLCRALLQLVGRSDQAAATGWQGPRGCRRLGVGFVFVVIDEDAGLQQVCDRGAMSARPEPHRIDDLCPEESRCYFQVWTRTAIVCLDLWRRRRVTFTVWQLPPILKLKDLIDMIEEGLRFIDERFHDWLKSRPLLRCVLVGMTDGTELALDTHASVFQCHRCVRRSTEIAL